MGSSSDGHESQIEREEGTRGRKKGEDEKDERATWQILRGGEGRERKSRDW